MNKQTFIIERYRREVYRIGWRLQYRSKKIRSYETHLYNDIYIRQESSGISHNRIWLQEEISKLPEKGRMIIDKLYMQGMTESEVARQLEMSQQAVSKWKKRMLQQLSQTMNL